MVFIEMLQYEHSIIPFKIMENTDDFPFVSILVHCQGIQMVEEVWRTIGTVEGMCRVLVFGFGTDKDG